MRRMILWLKIDKNIRSPKKWNEHNKIYWEMKKRKHKFSKISRFFINGEFSGKKCWFTLEDINQLEARESLQSLSYRPKKTVLYKLIMNSWFIVEHITETNL